MLKLRFGEDKVGLVHGRMKGPDKDAVMARFASGELAALVATTVIEVGVDVPNSTLMIVEGAERFGLAQLHQLRGRVGRGSGKSTCLLIRTQNLTEVGRARLAVMRETNDGFRIAEEDLRLVAPARSSARGNRVRNSSVWRRLKTSVLWRPSRRATPNCSSIVTAVWPAHAGRPPVSAFTCSSAIRRWG